jgi:mRNA-degrading endonuclease RelE of RelBE toxin-antitoxin system|tara:strand:+ start:287 stop:457 length:171 start_codon:yes stop_codon:yes gene_type:complete
MNWEIILTSKVQRQRKELPKKVRFRFDLLIKEMSIAGPYRKNWGHYSKLKMLPLPY